MRSRNKLFILCMILTGFFLVSWFWPETETMPVLAKVNTFQLEDVHEGMYDSKNGKIKVITFFYIDCPDICPLTLMDLRDLQSKLKSEGVFGDRVELIAITLDPKNDLPEKIKSYAENFGAEPYGWKWLRGTTEGTERIAKELQMQYQIKDDTVLYHSITLYLLDENNDIRAIYDMALVSKPVDTDKIFTDIKSLMDR